jgi:drug/metabolite transporter (DMT)-like permease
LLFGIAILSPVSTALSDGLAKRLLNRDRTGYLTRAELLAVRFTPATAVLFAFACWRGENIASLNIPVTILLAVFFGFAPLWILYSALEKGRLTDLAASEFLIPAISFLGTMHLHRERAAAGPILGAVLVGMGYVLYEMFGNVWIRDIFRKK